MKQKLVILGGGESGVGTAILGQQKGYDVFVSDYGAIKDTYAQVLSSNQINWEDKGHTVSEIIAADIVVKSPGIADVAPIICSLKQAGVKVISEIEFAAQFTDATIVAITGSNGKTSTASLTYALLKDDLNVALGGNIGDSFAAQVAAPGYENFVLELSSFQLDGIEKFAPHIAVLTNLSPDHLDRYENSYQKYIASKFRITMNQKASDYFIYDGDDVQINKWLASHEIKAIKLPFSLTQKLEQGAYIKENKIIITIQNTQFTMPIATLGLQG